MKILNLLERNTNVTVSQIERESGLSKFKINKRFKELNEDLAETGTIEMRFDSKGIIGCHDLSKKIVRQIRLKYLKESYLFHFLEDSLVQPVTVRQFSKRYFISVSRAYELKSELESFLDLYDLKFKDSEIVGDEFNIRKLLFNIYYQFFNRIELPTFGNRVKVDSKKMVDFVVSYFNLKLTPTGEVKLKLFFEINYFRIKNKHHIEFYSSCNVSGDSDKIKHFNEECQVFIAEVMGQPKLMSKKETQNLILFLSIENLINSDFNSSQNECIKRVTDLFMTEVTKVYLNTDRISDEYRHQLVHKMRTELIKINSRFLIRTDYMATKNEVTFDAKYQTFHKFVTNFLSLRISESHIQDKYQNFKPLYLEYMLLLINSIPLNYISRTIHVCVDISEGDLYNDYVIKMLIDQGESAIKFEKRLSNRTDIYISDVVMGHLKCRQILLDGLPEDKDWPILKAQIME